MKTQVPVYVHQMILIRGQIESKLFRSKQPLRFPGSNILFVQLVVLAIQTSTLNCGGVINLPSILQRPQPLSLRQKYTRRTAESLCGDISIFGVEKSVMYWAAKYRDILLCRYFCPPLVACRRRSCTSMYLCHR